eukprot:gene15348-biopygen6671
MPLGLGNRYFLKGTWPGGLGGLGGFCKTWRIATSGLGGLSLAGLADLNADLEDLADFANCERSTRQGIPPAPVREGFAQGSAGVEPQIMRPYSVSGGLLAVCCHAASSAGGRPRGAAAAQALRVV